MYDVEAFLKDLTELSVKHGLVINGCGECGSPWISKLVDGEERNSVAEHLSWDIEAWKGDERHKYVGYSTREQRQAEGGD